VQPGWPRTPQIVPVTGLGRRIKFTFVDGFTAVYKWELLQWFLATASKQNEAKQTSKLKGHPWH